MKGQTYNKLAEELDQAGFPYKHLADHPYVPELGELIEACGELGEENQFVLYNIQGGRWEAEWRSEDGIVSAIGKTPEEAVARLWLELNK